MAIIKSTAHQIAQLGDITSVELLKPTKPVKNIVQIQNSILTIEKNIKEIKNKETQINSYKQTIAMSRSGYPSEFDYGNYEKEIIKLEEEIKILKTNISKDFEFLSKEIEKNPQGVILTLANVRWAYPLKTLCRNYLSTPPDIDGLHHLQKTYFNILQLCTEDAKRYGETSVHKKFIIYENQRDGQALGAFFGSIISASRDIAKAKSKDKKFLEDIKKIFSLNIKVGPLGINLVELLVKALTIASGPEKANELKDRLFPGEAPTHPLQLIVTEYPENYNALENGFKQGFDVFISDFI